MVSTHLEIITKSIFMKKNLLTPNPHLQFALFGWYPCVNYWLNPQIWAWGYMLGLRPNFDEISFQLALVSWKWTDKLKTQSMIPFHLWNTLNPWWCCPSFGGRLNLETNTMTIGKDYKPKVMHEQNPKRPFKNKKQGSISTVQSNIQKINKYRTT